MTFILKLQVSDFALCQNLEGHVVQNPSFSRRRC